MEKTIKYGIYISCIILGIMILLLFRNNRDLNQLNDLREMEVTKLHLQNESLDLKISGYNLQVKHLRDSAKVLFISYENEKRKLRAGYSHQINDLRDLTDSQADSLAKLLGNSRDLLALKLQRDTCCQMLTLERKGLGGILTAKDSIISNQDRIISGLNLKIDNLNQVIALREDQIFTTEKIARRFKWQRNGAIVGGVCIFVLVLLTK